MVFEKVVVIDAKDHLLGRLASVIAKELLKGQRIVVVRCESLNISGKFIRNKLTYMSFLHKTNSVQPSHGPFHFRAPSKILWRTVRGMLPHKQPRGALALGKLKVFDGVPPPYDKKKRVVVPEALRVLRLKPMRKYTVLGDLSTNVGWRHGEVVSKLEEKRKLKAKGWYERKKALNKLRSQAVKNSSGNVTQHTQVLTERGHAH